MLIIQEVLPQAMVSRWTCWFRKWKLCMMVIQEKTLPGSLLILQSLCTGQAAIPGNSFSMNIVLVRRREIQIQWAGLTLVQIQP